MPRRTKIVATVGPASDTPDHLEALIHAGVDVCRIGLAHGEPAEHLARIVRIRAAAEAVGKHVAVLCDLPGPKVRAAPFAEGGVVLVEGDTVELVPAAEGDRSTGDRIGVEYVDLLDDLAGGDRVTLGDGLISLEVVDRAGDAWKAVVVAAGRVQGRPGVHLPAEKLRLIDADRRRPPPHRGARPGRIPRSSPCRSSAPPRTCSRSATRPAPTGPC